MFEDPQTFQIMRRSQAYTWSPALQASYLEDLRGRGRPATTQEDTPFTTSAETYLRGELLTYSPRSIALYHQEVMQAKAAGLNLAEQILRYMVRAYGYASLEDAEQQLARRPRE